MVIRIQCSQCGKKYKMPDAAAGRRASCKKCGEQLTIPKAEPSNTDNFLDALDAATANDSRSPNPAQLPPRVSGRKKQKQDEAERSGFVPSALQACAIRGAVAGFVLWAIFAVVDYVMPDDLMISLKFLVSLNLQPEDSVLIIGLKVVADVILNGCLGACFGAMVLTATGYTGSMAAGFATGVLAMIGLHGIGILILMYSGFVEVNIVLNLILGLPKGLVQTWFIFKTAEGVTVEVK